MSSGQSHDLLVAEAFEAALEVGDGSVLADLVEIGGSEIAICQPLGEHVIGGDEPLCRGRRRASLEVRSNVLTRDNPHLSGLKNGSSDAAGNGLKEGGESPVKDQTPPVWTSSTAVNFRKATDAVLDEVAALVWK